ncbi:hypothetical protein HPB47_016556, partial [Ixodes persulcatus]
AWATLSGMGDSQCPESGDPTGALTTPPLEASSPPEGQLNHVGWLAEHIGSLLLQPEYSDVTLVVAGARLPAHRLILASCSSYFRALLYGGMRESQEKEVVLRDTPREAFELLLRYIYTGQLQLSGLKEDVVLEVLELSHLYGFLELEAGVSCFLEQVLGVRNVCRIYDRACLYQLGALAQACRLFVDRHAMAILNSDSFLNLSPVVLREMIGRDSFFAPEVDIFRAVCSWAAHNPSSDPKPILEMVRLPLLTVPELLNVVRPTDLVGPDCILDAIQLCTETRDADRPYRGSLLPAENVASVSHGAQVLAGEMRSALLDGDSQGYDMERGFTRHPIEDGGSGRRTGILVKLGSPCILNHLALLLWDRDNRAYSYYIEVCGPEGLGPGGGPLQVPVRSWQKLYFKARVVQYIHIVVSIRGREPSPSPCPRLAPDRLATVPGVRFCVRPRARHAQHGNRVFHAVSLECRHVGEGAMPELEEGLVVPRENVATVSRCAYVVEGTGKYDWDSGYTCHQLGNGAIVVQLAQPYCVDSMRPVAVCSAAGLLWDCDSRQYSYYVEVSVDQQNWTMVADRRQELC